MFFALDPYSVAQTQATPSTAAVPATLETNYGGPRFMETDTTQRFPFGFRAKAFDPIHGYAELIYLSGAASTVAGDLVTYNSFTGVTTRGAATADTGFPIAFAISPCVAGQFGWYQVVGAALANNNGTAAVDSPAFQKATATIGSASVTGTGIANAVIATANGSTFTKTGTTRNGSTEVFFSNLDGVYVGLPISGTGIPGGATVAAGYNNSPNARNSSAGSATSLLLSAAATADGTVTVTFTRTNKSVLAINNPAGEVAT